MHEDDIVQPITRREFLRGACFALAAGALSGCAAHGESDAAPTLYKAKYCERLSNGAIGCQLCPHACVIGNGRRGHCGVRENRNGVLYSLVYGRPCITNLDPIEKKPLFHVLPGARAFSLATVGCNFTCKFCQNWDASQATVETLPAPYKAPQEIAQNASSEKARLLAFTYTEPTVSSEYILDCVAAARELGIGSVVVSNGFIQKEPLLDLAKCLTAYKVDLKAFTDDFYHTTCGGRLAPVLDTLERLAAAGTWFEVVVLIIPGMNDSPEELKRMSGWIVKTLGPDVPVHFSRYHPAYKLQNLPPTPMQTLARARETAQAEGCHFVYLGNVAGDEGQHTYCPACKSVLLRRYGYMVLENKLNAGACFHCGAKIPGVWA